MNGLIVDNEGAIRLAIFFCAFAIIAIAERRLPHRRMSLPWVNRWLNNLGLSVVNTLCLRVLVPFSATFFAIYAVGNGWGLLEFLDLPTWLSILLFVLGFDCAIYFQHRLFHAVRPLWLLHRVHHTDLDYDITTGTRFHPLSIIISMAIKICLVLVLGGPVVAVLISEVLLNLTSMFNHSNIKIPSAVDTVLRNFVVTPDMHRVHHSSKFEEYNRNFGFNFPWWDRVFGTYQAQPELGHTHMVLGIDGFGESESVRVQDLLMQPFRDNQPGKVGKHQ
ncbi:MAG: sterol desaturase family protein [bacterium]|nr:sterol desaturase family protein [Gammaproteobacteria bacterium]